MDEGMGGVGGCWCWFIGTDVLGTVQLLVLLLLLLLRPLLAVVVGQPTVIHQKHSKRSSHNNSQPIP